MRLMTRALVYPSRLRFFLPYPGRKPDPKVQRYIPPAGNSLFCSSFPSFSFVWARGVCFLFFFFFPFLLLSLTLFCSVEAAKMRAKAAKDPSKKAKDAAETDSLSLKQLREQRKNAQRKKVACDFFEKVLGDRSPSGMEVWLRSLCDDELQVFGFSDMDPEIVGYQRLILAVTDLSRRFQDLKFDVDDTSVLEEGVLITWSMRGVQLAKVWSKMPIVAVPPVQTGFRGTAMVSFDSFGKIIAVEFFTVLC